MFMLLSTLVVLGTLGATSTGEQVMAAPADAGASARAPVRIVVYDLTADEIAPQHLALITASLITEVRKLKGVSVIGMEEVRAMLSTTEREVADKCMDDACMTSIAGALGAAVVVSGGVGRIGASTVLNAKRIDMKTAEVQESVTRRMSGGGGEELLEALGPTVEALFPDFELRLGMKRGVPAEQVARWNPPPLAPWMTIAAGSTGAALSAVAGFFYWRQRSAESSYRSLNASSINGPVVGARLTAYQDRARSSYRNVLISGPLAAASWAAGGVMYWFTDWKGRSAAPGAAQIVPMGTGASLLMAF